jgi:hypothetical protein
VQQYLNIWDLVLTPIFLLVLSLLARRHRDKHYPPGHRLRRYYLPGLYVKFGGAIFIALIYQYYYGEGDTFFYFEHAKTINSALDDSFTNWYRLLVRTSPDQHPELYKYTSQLTWYRDPSSYTVAAITAVLGLFTGTTYMPTALLFAFVSYTGIWAMYRTFANIYPKLTKELAIAFLFIPSTIVWGSAIFKDTICMFGLGWMVYTTFRIFINRDLSIRNFLLLASSFYLIGVIKVYILLAFVPSLSLWLLLTYSHKIQSAALRGVVTLMFFGVTAAGFFFFSKQFSKELSRYSLERVAYTSQMTRGWITYASGEEGSAYDLGEFDPTVGGMLSKFPAAVAVTLYRPFLWEAKKVIVLLSALEGLLFIVLTVYTLFRNGAGSVFSGFFKDPNILFCLIFSLIFAFAVGISTYNFGSLSRYKIPCLPFYAAFLILLTNKKNEYSRK